jgi:hypothetical protein
MRLGTAAPLIAGSLAWRLHGSVRGWRAARAAGMAMAMTFPPDLQLWRPLDVACQPFGWWIRR